MTYIKTASAALCATLLASCASVSFFEKPVGLNEAKLKITDEGLRSHIKTLASDEFGGRAPSTPGETKTLNHLKTAFTELGFKPGNGDSFLQQVPLVAIEAKPSMVLEINGSQYQYKKDMVLGTSRISALEQLNNSELVFVGYGIDAPEYNWNDYEGLDVSGKTVVMLVNDPGFIEKDPSRFDGEAMTYYGRWTYKFEEASRKGAAGAIIIHQTAPASYPWSVVENSWVGPQMHFDRADNNMGRVAVEGWVSEPIGRELFAKANLDFDALTRQAAKGPMHVKMADLKANVSITSTITRSTSHNFIATLPGTKRPDEHILYTAHWDHLGTDESRRGDKIYNGAHDNATGTAGMIEIAKAFSALTPRPERSVTFLALTAEEQGLLGAKYYAANPIILPEKTVANINMDSLNVLGRTKDVRVVGRGKNSLDEHLALAAKKQNRELGLDPRASAGGYYRSDHFAFANLGIPAMYAGGGQIPVDDATATYRKKMGLIVRGCYHQPCDKYREEWDLSGALEDLNLFFDVGHQLATTEVWPTWSKTAEFQRQ